MKSKEFHWSLQRADDYFGKRGFGLWWTYGSLGTTYGDPRNVMTLTFTALVLKWEFVLRFDWRGKEE